MQDDSAGALELTDPMPLPEAMRRPSLDLEAARVKLAEQLFGVTMEAPRIGRFRVLEKLGEGGMGEVYAAFDKELDRRVAIKVLRDAAAGSEEHARLVREAQAMARLSHPNVVQVYEVGEHRGQIFIAMEFVKGSTLSRWLAAEERTWQEILDIFEQAGRGLHAAHLAGVVHRDFKPDNVLVGADGRARVADFGLAHGDARVRRDDGDPSTSHSDALAAPLTRRGAVMGTPAFMSPEQYDGAPTDPRTDQFSFCVALFEALYKRRPFTGESLLELAVAVHSGVVPEPPAGTPVPAWVHRALATGLAPDPGHRHASMEVLLAELSRDVPGARDPWRVMAVALALLILVGVVALGLLARERPPTAEELARVAELAHQARDAAARAHWVYPSPDAPQDTAILRVVALEDLGGPVAARAHDEAEALRGAMAGELTALGDTYWTTARPYARDFYAQALVFRPDDPRARERGGFTPGELAELRDKAIHGTFAAHELIAVEPLLVLAGGDLAARGLGPDTRRPPAPRRSRDPEALPAAAPAPAEPDPRLATLMPVPKTGDEPPRASAPPPASPEPAALDKLLPTGTRRDAPPASPRVSPPAAEPGPDLSAETDHARARQLVRDAEAASRRGARDDATKLFNQALAADPRSDAALIGLSDLAFDDSDYSAAVDYAEKAVKLAPARGDYRVRLGDAYFKVMNFAQAQRAYEAAAERGDPRAAERLAKLRSKLGAP